MPLLKGKENVGTNIREMENSGHSRSQSIAAALNTAYGPKKRADGGNISDTPPKDWLNKRGKAATTQKEVAAGIDWPMWRGIAGGLGSIGMGAYQLYRLGKDKDKPEPKEEPFWHYPMVPDEHVGQARGGKVKRTKRADGGEASINRDGKGNKVPVADPYPLPGSEFADWYKGPLNASKKLYGDLSSGNWRNWKAQPRPPEEDEEEPASSAVNRAGKGDKLSKAKGGAIEAALRAARKPQKRADGGHVGPLPGSTPGRADAIHTSVEDGSYIVPAYAVAFLGDSNTQAGFKKLSEMFPHSSQHRAEGGLIAGSSLPHLSAAPRLIGIPRPHLTSAPHLAGVPHMRSVGLPMHMAGPRIPGMPHLAKGGNVDVRLSDGEYAIPPEAIIRKYGDLNRGHRELDKWVEKIKNAYQKKLGQLPGPVKS